MTRHPFHQSLHGLLRTLRAYMSDYHQFLSANERAALRLANVYVLIADTVDELVELLQQSDDKSGHRAQSNPTPPRVSDEHPRNQELLEPIADELRIERPASHERLVRSSRRTM